MLKCMDVVLTFFESSEYPSLCEALLPERLSKFSTMARSEPKYMKMAARGRFPVGRRANNVQGLWFAFFYGCMNSKGEHIETDGMSVDLAQRKIKGRREQKKM